MNDLLVKPRPITLSFPDPSVEAAYRTAVLPRLRWHGRVAIVVGMLVYFLFATLDAYHVPAHLRADVWAIRGVAALGGLLILAASWHPRYTTQVANVCLMLVGGVGGLSLLGIFWILPAQTLSHYHAGLLLVTFYTYNFLGTRFVYALLANLVVYAVYNGLFGWLQPIAQDQWVSHNFHLISANVLGGTAAYLAEYQRRRLFMIERLLQHDHQQMRHSALHDALTDLPNRVLLMDRIEQALSHARRSGTSGVLLFVDLDGFKSVNDTHGHEAGDKVLREAARRMRDCVRESDTLARIGGDEFVLLSLGLSQEEQLQTLSDKLLQVLESPYAVHSHRVDQPALVRISASIGACFFPQGDCDAAELLRRSDEAMYHAKRDGGAYSVWSQVRAA
jgi:diguanylate cyclase